MARLAFCILILCLCLPLAAQIVIRNVTFDADFPVDEAKLTQATGLVKGTPFDSETAKTSVTRIQDFLAAEGKYYIRVLYPDIIPISDKELDLHYTLREVLSSEAVQVRFTGSYEMWAAARQVKRTFSRDVKSKPISPAQRHQRYPCPRRGAGIWSGVVVWI